MRQKLITIKQKAQCCVNFLEFIKTCFKYNHKREFLVNSHHKIIIDVLIDVFLGYKSRLIINIPPRYGKTEIAVVNLIAWTLGICPDSQFIHVSYSKKLASHNTYKTKHLIESNIYKEIFPNIKLRKDSKAKDHFSTTKQGMIYSSGSEGSITGFGAGLNNKKNFSGAIIIDDPHKPMEIHSKTTRESVISFFKETLESRKNSANTPIILIMQRLHKEDLSGFLLSGGNGETWDHINLPAIINNKPLWSKKQNYEELERLKKYNKYVFSGQYMQNPTPLGGALFKEKQFKYYKILPKPVEKYIITADTAMKTKEYNDFSVFQLWAKIKNNIYLIDQIRGKWEAPILKKRALSFWNKNKHPKLHYMYIEDKASGTGLIQDIKQTIPIRPLGRYIDKITRVFGVLPYIESGFVFLPDEGIFLSDLLQELSVFNPKMTHTHDDQVDCLIDACEILLLPQKTAKIY